MNDPLKITWSKGSADVEWCGKKVRFFGDFSLNGFIADPETMKWMYPDRDKPATKKEQEEWVQVINNYYSSFKNGRRLFFRYEE